MVKSFLISVYLFLCINVFAQTETAYNFDRDQFFVKIGIAENKNNFNCVVRKGTWNITEASGKIRGEISANDSFIIKLKDNAEPPKTFYRLVLHTTENINDYIVEIELLKQKYGEDNIFISNKLNNMDKPEAVLEKQKTWYICYGEYKNQESAEKDKLTYGAKSVIKDCSNTGYGEFLISISGKSQKELTVKNIIRLKPTTEDSTITLKDVLFPSMYSSGKTESRTYDGILEFYIDNKSKISVSNELDIENYLAGVVPAEIGDDAPLEAFKAQAVCARSETIAKIYKKKHANDNYDLCSDVHCQAYHGISKKTQKSSKAVKDCAGEVLTFKGQIIEAVYSSNSGGHTENIEDIWESPSMAYFKGVLDIANAEKYQKFSNLKDESVFEEWVNSPPSDLYSHSEQKGMPNWAKKYFRWEKSFSGIELTSIINKKTKIGKVKDIKLGTRGVGGRLKSITITGDKDSTTIRRELPIRIALGSLNSAAFRIKSVQKSGGYIDSITFEGAGWGHGVGMCQMGARIRAVKGQTYKQILSAYFPNTKIQNIYSESEE